MQFKIRMMKKLLLLTTLSAFANVCVAQTITSNDLQTPGKGYKLGINNSAAQNISIGGKGAGQNWDFSSLALEAFDTVGTLVPSTTPYGSSFPSTSNATITEDSDGKTYSYYTVSPTKVEVTGIAYESTQLPGTPSAVLKTIKALNFYETLPIVLGNKTYSTGTYFGKAKYSPYFGVDSIELTMVIEKWDTVDASGTIKIPSSNVITYDVIRLKTHLKRTISVRIFSPIAGGWVVPPAPNDVPKVSEEVNYNFWASGIGNEVFKVIFDGPNATSPFSVKWFLNSATGIVNEASNSNNIVISPNPASSQIRLNGIAGNYDLSIHTLQGESVLNKKAMLGDQTLDVSTLTSGIYMATIETANGVKTKTKLVIQ
jgi:hypothetical protein